MEKTSLFSVPENFDFSKSNDFYKTVEAVDVNKVTYTGQASLSAGEWTYNTDERCYMISPTLINGTSGETRGYLRLYPKDAYVSAEDEVLVEFEMKCAASNMPTGVNNGLIVDFMDKSGVYVSNLKTQYKVSSEYRHYRTKYKVPVNFNIQNLRFLFGVAGSPAQAQAFTLFIRNIKLTIIRNSSTNIVETYAGMNVIHFDDQGDKLDNSSTHAATGARDTSLLSGFYKYVGLFAGVQQTGALNGNGALIVLPYRRTDAQKIITQIAVINGSDPDKGIHIRYYFGTTWTAWSRIGNA